MCPHNKITQLRYPGTLLFFPVDFVFVFFNGFVVIIINYHYNYLWMTGYTIFFTLKFTILHYVQKNDVVYFFKNKISDNCIFLV